MIAKFFSLFFIFISLLIVRSITAANVLVGYNQLKHSTLLKKVLFDEGDYQYFLMQHDSNVDYVVRLLECQNEILIYEADSDPIGVICFKQSPLPSLGYIHYIGVLPEYRRLGVAAAMVIATVRSLIKRGVTLMYVMVIKNKSEGALLCNRFGGKVFNTTDNFIIYQFNKKDFEESIA